MIQSLVDYWQSRQDLRRETAFMTSLLESVTDLIFMKDAKGIYMTCNKMFAQYAGLEPDEIIGGADCAFLPEERCQVYLAQDRQVMREGKPLTYREEVKRPDGSPCLLETVKSPVYSAAGECIGLIGIGRDIADRVG